MTPQFIRLPSKRMWINLNFLVDIYFNDKPRDPHYPYEYTIIGDDDTIVRTLDIEDGECLIKAIIAICEGEPVE